MISRRLLRIKVLQTIYSHYMSGNEDIAKTEKELSYSIQKSYDLYFLLMLLSINVADYANEVLESGTKKLKPTQEDLNPNFKFANNKIVAQLRENTALTTKLTNSKLSWVNCPELIKRLYKELSSTEEYTKYLESPTNTYEDDKRILIFFYENVVCECDLLYSTLEDMSCYWIDSVEFIISMVIRTLGKYKIGFDNTYPMPTMYHSQDDKIFVDKLFRSTITNNDYFRNLIKQNTNNWDLERIAFLDILIMQIALAEITSFPEIPVKVSFNEYIEIAKFFSTSKSCLFINGVLDAIVQKLIKENKIKKLDSALVEKSNDDKNE